MGKHPELRMLLMVKLKKPSMPPSAGLECIQAFTQSHLISSMNYFH